MTAPKLAYNIREAAAVTGISVAGINRLVRAGELRTVKPKGCSHLIPAKYLVEFLDGLDERKAS